MSDSLFARPSEFSNLKKDEHIQFITGAAWLENVSDTGISAEGEPGQQVWKIPVRVWVYEPENSYFRLGAIAKTLKAKYGLEVTEATRENFDRRVNLLVADNERNKKIVVEIEGQLFRLNKTDARGHSETIIELPESRFKPQQKQVTFRAILEPGDKRTFLGKCLLIPRNGVSLISDIDDTVKVSEVGDHGKLFDHTFYQNFKAVAGMSSLYQALDRQNVSTHFVSSSPWQLYPELDAFLDNQDFPERSLYLKTVRFKDRSFFNLFKSGDKTKPQQIAPLLERYPQRKFILIGDSGEEDQKVYEAFLKSHPQQVLAAFIRELETVNGQSASGNAAHNNAENRIENRIGDNSTASKETSSDVPGLHFFKQAEDIELVLKEMNILAE